MWKIVVVVSMLLPVVVSAHCDTLDGPVIVDARLALAKGNVTPVLKWVRLADETEIREAFAQALQVRKLGPQALALADQHFFETLVRVHRAGEGAPYTGLKPAGTEIDHAVVAADQALKSGSDEALIQMLTEALRSRLHERFVQARRTGEHAGDSVEAGRKYVAAYVEFVHYVEGVHQAIARQHDSHASEHAH